MIIHHIYGTVLNNNLKETTINEKEDFIVSIKTTMDILCYIEENSPIKTQKKKCRYGNQCKQNKCRFYHPN